jgi:hypothetical protein
MSSQKQDTTKNGNPMTFPIAIGRLRMAKAILSEDVLRQLRPKLSREAVCEMYPLSPYDIGGLEAYYEIEIAKRASPTIPGGIEALWLQLEPRIRRMIQEEHGVADTDDF